MLALIGNLGPGESLAVIVVMILVFGGRLPDVARDIMRGVAKLRRSMDDLRREIDLDGDIRRIHRDISRPTLPPRPKAPGSTPREKPPTAEEPEPRAWTPSSGAEAESTSAGDGEDASDDESRAEAS